LSVVETLKCSLLGLGGTQDHWKWHHSDVWIRQAHLFLHSMAMSLAVSTMVSTQYTNRVYVLLATLQEISDGCCSEHFRTDGNAPLANMINC